MSIQSGYKTITPIQLGNALWALQRRSISAQTLRVYLATFLLIAAREAASRYRRKRREKPREFHRFSQRELERLTGLQPGRVRQGIKQLSAAGLLSFAEGNVDIPKAMLPRSEEFQNVLSCRRSPSRPIPVPRSILRFMARSRASSRTKVIVAYLVRGLSITARTGEVRHKGTVKASWIARTLGLSARAVKYAQAELRRMGWISKDTQSFQRKLNRDGAYFMINLTWRFQSKRGAVFEVGDNTLAEENMSTLANPGRPSPKFALPPAGSTPIFAPPIEDKKTSNEESKDQRTHEAEPDESGVYERKEREEAIAPPTWRCVVAEDLHSFGRLESLYFQALKRQWIDSSEATALSFITAAVHAREAGREPPRLFVALVRRQLWHHANQAQEDRAREVLNRFRTEAPDRFRAHRVVSTEAKRVSPAKAKRHVKRGGKSLPMAETSFHIEQTA